MSATLIQADYAKYCGKEVRIIDSSGKTFAFSEGPLFIWDVCPAGGADVSADISGEGSKPRHCARLGLCWTQLLTNPALAFVELKGDGDCLGDNPGGLTVQILDNNIFDPVVDDNWQPSFRGPHTARPSGIAAAIASASSVAAASAAQPVVTAVPVVSAAPVDANGVTGGGTSEPAGAAPCAYGKKRCQGLSAQTCNYIDNVPTLGMSCVSFLHPYTSLQRAELTMQTG
jgi:hypothetical protein